MGFMRPIAERFAAYHVETNEGTEIVPEDVCGCIDTDENRDANEYDLLLQYCEGTRVIGDVERKEGWYSRLSASGYLDATDWRGPFDTSDAALDDVKAFYDVNDAGDSLDESEDLPENV